MLATLESGAPAGGNGNTRTLGNPQGRGSRWKSELTVGSQQFKTKKVKPKTQVLKSNQGHPPLIFGFEHDAGWRLSIERS